MTVSHYALVLHKTEARALVSLASELHTSYLESW